ncbi:trehalose-phosphatase [Microbacterium sp. P04]|uniref:trehalose-phosphatase n=1 Tax=Microbacterium sp. P04 TaxID=3366947 RepID=UPI003745816E
MSTLDDALVELAATPVLLVALDFDGTVSPHDDDPMKARMLSTARAAIDALAALPATTVALVSGRSLGDLRIIAEHDDDSLLLLAGSHGAEFWRPGEGIIEPADESADGALRDRLFGEAQSAVAGYPGVWIEPKTFGFAVHTRLVKDVDAAAAANAAVDAIMASEAPDWRRRIGQNIVEFAFRHEGKDTAVARLREQTGATAVLFAGDDVTDEDALRSLLPGDLGVHIGTNETAATVSLPDIPAFAEALGELARLRASRPE